MPSLCGTTRWFKHDRDKLWLVYTLIVPVMSEPPCIIKEHENIDKIESYWFFPLSLEKFQAKNVRQHGLKGPAARVVAADIYMLQSTKIPHTTWHKVAAGQLKSADVSTTQFRVQQECNRCVMHLLVSIKNPKLTPEFESSFERTPTTSPQGIAVFIGGFSRVRKFCTKSPSIQYFSVSRSVVGIATN